MYTLYTRARRKKSAQEERHMEGIHVGFWGGEREREERCRKSDMLKYR